jgi:hypothetical protein
MQSNPDVDNSDTEQHVIGVGKFWTPQQSVLCNLLSRSDSDSVFDNRLHPPPPFVFWHAQHDMSRRDREHRGTWSGLRGNIIIL